jgi:hypothetical protein
LLGAGEVTERVEPVQQEGDADDDAQRQQAGARRG